MLINVPTTDEICTLPIFDQVPRDLIERVITGEMLHSFNDEDVIFRRGAEPKNLVVIVHGNVSVYVENTFIVHRSAPSVIGEQAIIDNTIHSATAEAQGYVKALVIPRAAVEQLMSDAAFIRNLLKAVSCKLREATDERALRFYNEKILLSEFRAHLSLEVADSLLNSGIDYGKPRYIRDAVILLSDIRSFTDHSALMTPEEIANQLSPYLSNAVDIVHQHDGLVDKFIGDAVLAVWGYIPEENKVEMAFRCAVEMVRAAARMRFGGESISIGVGLNVGQVFMGNIGSDGKRQFTVLGMPVNLAARFEGKAKELNAPIVMGREFYEALPDTMKDSVAEHPDQRVKGDRLQTLYTHTPAISELGEER
jgi:class 3 adenylate cyclase